jgi:hypothetical protein
MGHIAADAFQTLPPPLLWLQSAADTNDMRMEQNIRYQIFKEMDIAIRTNISITGLAVKSSQNLKRLGNLDVGESEAWGWQCKG